MVLVVSTVVIGVFVIAFITISLVFAAITSVAVGTILIVNISRVRVIANFTPSTSRAVIYFIVLIIMLVAVGRLTNVTIILVVCIIEVMSSSIVLLLVAIVIIVPRKFLLFRCPSSYASGCFESYGHIRSLVGNFLEQTPLGFLDLVVHGLACRPFGILLPVTLLLPLHEPGIVHVWGVHVGLISHSSVHIWTRGHLWHPVHVPIHGRHSILRGKFCGIPTFCGDG